MKKELRQKKIAALIKKKRLFNQEGLIQALEEEGIQATQATVSRDIREMRIVKETDANGKSYYTLLRKETVDPKARIIETISEIVLDVTNVHFINIIKTTPRSANVLAALLDDDGLSGVIGTLAGYDTVVLFSPDDETAVQVKQYFIEHIGN